METSYFLLLLLIPASGVLSDWNVSLRFASPVFLSSATESNYSLEVQCGYSLNDKFVYSLIMFRGECQFYRYLPGNSPKFYSCPGVNLDVSRSKGNTVVMRNVSIQSADTYKCEVSREKVFTTKMATKLLEVIVKPQSGPNLTLDKNMYVLGEMLHAVCNTYPSYPLQYIQWIVNGATLSDNLYDNYTEDADDGFTVSTVSKLTFKLGRRHFGKQGFLLVKCISTMKGHYESFKTVKATLNATNIHSGDKHDVTEALQTSDSSSQTSFNINDILLLLTAASAALTLRFCTI